MLNVGLIGAGKWGQNYIRTLSNIEDVQLMWAYTRKSVLDTTNVSVIHEIQYDKIDCVIISSPSDTHYEIAKHALEHGKHVLCEKPLTKSSKEVKELIDLAHQKNLVLMVGHEYLYHSGIIELKRILQSEETGKIDKLIFERTGMHENVDDVLWEVGPHDIYIAMYLLSKTDPEIIVNEGDNFNRLIDLSFNDVPVYIEISCRNPQRVRKIIAITENKQIYFDENALTIESRFNEQHLLDPVYFAKKIVHSSITPLENECRVFFDAIENKVTLYENQYSALHTIELLEKLTK